MFDTRYERTKYMASIYSIVINQKWSEATCFLCRQNSLWKLNKSCRQPTFCRDWISINSLVYYGELAVHVEQIIFFSIGYLLVILFGIRENCRIIESIGSIGLKNHQNNSCGHWSNINTFYNALFFSPNISELYSSASFARVECI